jgi:hypothetical protein
MCSTKNNLDSLVSSQLLLQQITVRPVSLLYSNPIASRPILPTPQFSPGKTFPNGRKPKTCSRRRSATSPPSSSLSSSSSSSETGATAEFGLEDGRGVRWPGCCFHLSAACSLSVGSDKLSIRIIAYRSKSR